MEKTEFMNKLEEVRVLREKQKNILRERKKLLGELREVYAKKSKKGSVIVAVSIGVALIAGAIANRICNAIYLATGVATAWFFLVLAVAAVIGFIITSTVLSKIFEANDISEAEEYNKKIKDKTREVANVNSEISQVFCGDLTPKYCVFVVLDKIINYFMDGRVDSTKEAVNMFIQEYGEPEQFLYSDDDGMVDGTLEDLLTGSHYFT